MSAVKATDENLTSENWEYILDVCDRVGANSSGGVLGKMISPQNLAVGTSATGLQGREGDLLRLVLKWSIALTLVMAIWVTIQAYLLPFLIP